jgi:O-antigen ligase
MPGFPRTIPADAVWATGFVLLLAAGALVIPAAFWVLLGAAAACGVTFLAWRHLTGFCVAWLVLAGLTPEMTLHDLIGPDTYSVTIAVVKAIEIGLGALCVLRFGLRPDIGNPAWAFVVIFALGLANGLHPGLGPTDSLRSLVGSVAPFVFFFSRVPPGWSAAIIRAVRLIPLLSLGGGTVLDVAGLRPLFVDSGGMRLAGLGHPAFLAGVCLTAIYACLIQLYRHGNRVDLILLGINLLLLLLTGARAPLTYAVMVVGLALAFVGSPALPAHRRWLLLIGAATLLPVLALTSGALTEFRLFNLIESDSTNLSGRDLLWPPFEAAAAASPWFGWGVGAGNVIIPPDSEVAQLLQTWAPHNEYLRIEVEGGRIGLGLLIGLFVLWVIRHTSGLPRQELIILRLVFAMLAAHMATDNVLISTPACVLFAFVAAVWAPRPVPCHRERG